MRYLLDTNIISETYKIKPNPNVIEWLNSIESEKLFISVISIGEIRKGIESVEDDKKKTQLVFWLEEKIIKWFAHNLLEVNIEVAEKWGFILAKYKIPAIDALLAATAITKNLKIVTRNVKDFQIPGLEVINPWNLN